MNFKKISHLIAFSAALACTVSLSSFANGNNDGKVIEKARDAVENAAPDDWYTLAINADKCFKRNENMAEASRWLDRSIAIIETPYNMELKGDYYVKNKQPKKALAFYVKAMKMAKENHGDADITEIQKKVAEIINIGG